MAFFRRWELCVASVISCLTTETLRSLSVNPVRPRTAEQETLLRTTSDHRNIARIGDRSIRLPGVDMRSQESAGIPIFVKRETGARSFCAPQVVTLDGTPAFGKFFELNCKDLRIHQLHGVRSISFRIRCHAMRLWPRLFVQACQDLAIA
jgi:hypothetical protein